MTTPLWLANIVVGTPQPVTPRVTRHRSRHLARTSSNLDNIIFRQANDGVELRIGTLVLQRSKANRPEQG